MNNHNSIEGYIRYVSNTIINTPYITSYDAKKVLNKLKKDKIIDEIVNESDESTEKINYREVLVSKLYRHRMPVVKTLQDFEYEKPYKYSVLYKIDDLSTKINDLIQKKVNSNLILDNPEIEHLNRVFNMPALVKQDDYFDFKFSYLVRSKNDDSRTIKYPVVVVIHKKLNVLQIKFDGLPSNYKDEEFFAKVHDKIKVWFENVLDLSITEFNSFKAIKTILNKKETSSDEYKEVIEYIKASEDRFNGKTVLRADNNDHLPIIDQLKLLVDEFKDDNDRLIIEEFIKSLELGVTYYIRGLKWHRNVTEKMKTTQIVTFRKNYSASGFTLIHFQNGNQTREKMNYVIEYLARHQE